MLIDSHCHLAKFAREGTLESVLDRAVDAGISHAITIGTEKADWFLYHELASKFPSRVSWTVGLHPCEVNEDWEEDLMLVSSSFAMDPAPCAIGETGLDFFHLPKFPDDAAEIKSRQINAFRAQLEIALQLDCPVVVHSRNAFSECVSLIDAVGVNWKRVVFHCFSGGPDEIRQLNARGGRGSFTGIATYKSAESIRAAVCEQGIEMVMVETDSPYLTPEPLRGKPNEPAFMRHTAERLAAVLGTDLETFARHASENTATFFGLPQSIA